MSDLDRMSEDTPSQQPPTTTTAAEEDDDPIVASYSVFIKPSLPKHRKIVVLDYVNRTAPDPAQLQQPKILGLRIKPNTGMYEVDIPIETSDNYDKNKGIAWGVALQKSMEAKKGGSLGLAGGFGVGGLNAARASGRRGGGGGNNEEEEPLTWAEATRLDKVLRKQTLGGGRKAEEGNTKHMVGVVQGKNIHLTPVSSVVHLRPVAHHLDAASEQERLSRPQPGGPGAGGAPGSGSAAEKAAAGRAIHMTIKTAMDGTGGVAAETISDRLRAVQKEPWKRMQYFYDESEAAWGAYNECLLLRTSGEHVTATTKPDEKGKGKEVAGGEKKVEDGDDSGSPELVDRVPHLKTEWVEDDLLRAMSGIGKDDKKPGEEAVALSEWQAKFAAKLEAAKKDKGKAPATVPAAAAGAQEAPTSSVRRRGRPARGGAAASTRGGRTAAGGSAGNAMQID